MKIIPIILILLITNASPTFADVFKCQLSSGKIIYQSTACSSSAILKDIIKVQPMTAVEINQANQKLKKWQDEQAANEAIKQEAENQRKLALEQEESLALQHRIANAEEQQAIAAKEELGLHMGYRQPFVFSYPYNRLWNSPIGQHLPYPGINPMLPPTAPTPPFNTVTPPSPQNSDNATSKTEKDLKTKTINLR